MVSVILDGEFFMGILGDILNGFLRAAESNANRYADKAHDFAKSGNFQGRRLNERGREHMYNKEYEYREMAAKARAMREEREARERMNGDD